MSDTGAGAPERSSKDTVSAFRAPAKQASRSIQIVDISLPSCRDARSVGPTAARVRTPRGAHSVIHDTFGV